jgi:energy-coupling factor transporter ATP-binding protein EcfA2
MHLNELRITNCFGFANTRISLAPNLLTILGRNSSGKTALLDAINSLAPQRSPEDHPRFINFRPTSDNPQLTATFAVDAAPALDVQSRLSTFLRSNGLPQQGLDHEDVQGALVQIDAIYTTLFEEIASEGSLKLIKFAERQCQLTAGDQFKQANERRATIKAILNRTFPGDNFTVAGARHRIEVPTPSDLDRIAADIVPPITYYNEQYSLTDDLPDHLTTTTVRRAPNGVTRAFTALLDASDVTTVLTTNDPDDQDRLRTAIQLRADALANTISNESNRLVQITLSITPSGLQITLRTDGKKSFYRHLSDATKFLIAYHIHAHHHEPGAILLFDEPSRGLHATAEKYLRDFLQRLATGNHVIVSTHSERLLDLDHLDGVRLMQQDEHDRPVVLNSLRPPRDRQNYLLALQPIFDAIGVSYANQTLTYGKVILTEGLTDYLYLRAIHELTNTIATYGIAPGRGESTLFTLVPFMASQAVSIKIILDHPNGKDRLQDAYGIPDPTFFLIPTTGATHGIEDLFTPRDYCRVLNAAGYETVPDDLGVGNSAYAKQTNKRLVAQTFRNAISTYTIESFDDVTKANIGNLLAFCANDDWFSI